MAKTTCSLNLCFRHSSVASNTCSSLACGTAEQRLDTFASTTGILAGMCCVEASRVVLAQTLVGERERQLRMETCGDRAHCKVIKLSSCSQGAPEVRPISADPVYEGVEDLHGLLGLFEAVPREWDW